RWRLASFGRLSFRFDGFRVGLVFGSFFVSSFLVGGFFISRFFGRSLFFTSRFFGRFSQNDFAVLNAADVDAAEHTLGHLRDTNVSNRGLTRAISVQNAGDTLEVLETADILAQRRT